MFLPVLVGAIGSDIDEPCVPHLGLQFDIVSIVRKLVVTSFIIPLHSQGRYLSFVVILHIYLY